MYKLSIGSDDAMPHRSREDAAVAAVELALAAALDRSGPPRIHNALVHAVFPGGARVRPRLCLAVARAASGASPSQATHAAAAAVELIHCASLVHDDLPCFDDADLRRGRPSVHRTFGEATAVLAGDALIATAFEVLAAGGAPPRAIVALARATGAHGGLVSGQALELEDDVDVGAYHGAKTAALFEAAAALGAITSDVDPEGFAALGRALGLYYQLADDAADAFGDPDVIGKPVGRDGAKHRPSAIARVRSREGARALLEREASHLLAAVPECPGAAELRSFVSIVVERLVAHSGVADLREDGAPLHQQVAE